MAPFLDWSHISPETLKAAGERGSRVHAAIAAEINGDFPMLPDNEKGYLDAARKFLGYVTGIILVEQRLISDVHQYTGQVDIVCQMSGDDRITVLDWKTSATLSKSWPIQVAAYGHLVKANALLPKESASRHMVVQLKKNGTFKIHEYTQPAHDFAIFLNVLTAYRFFNPKPTNIDFDNL
jgi:hypothetical protein